MKTHSLLLIALFIFITGCSHQNQHLKVKQFSLTNNKTLHLTKEYGEPIYQKRIDTKGYTTLRIFAHVLNQAYKENPLPKDSSLKIIAYQSTQHGSWGYFSKAFNYNSMSSLSALADIPIIGAETRINIYAYKMKDLELDIDVLGSLF